MNRCGFDEDNPYTQADFPVLEAQLCGLIKEIETGIGHKNLTDIQIAAMREACDTLGL
jgi:hypothetical protein